MLFTRQLGDPLLRSSHPGSGAPDVEFRRGFVLLHRSVVIDLPAAIGEVSGPGECLRQCDVLLQRIHFPQSGSKSVYARAGRTQPGHQTHTGRIAEGGLAMSIGKKCASRGQ